MFCCNKYLKLVSFVLWRLLTFQLKRLSTSEYKLSCFVDENSCIDSSVNHIWYKLSIFIRNGVSDKKLWTFFRKTNTIVIKHAVLWFRKLSISLLFKKIIKFFFSNCCFTQNNCFSKSFRFFFSLFKNNEEVNLWN